MKRYRSFVRIVIAAWLLSSTFIAQVHSADTLIFGTFRGVTTSSTNAESLFGTTSSLIGREIVGTFQYDISLLPSMHPVSTATLGAWLQSYSVSPFSQITETINGVTLTFGGTYYEELDLGHGYPTLGELPNRYQMFAISSHDLSPLTNSTIYKGASIEVGAYDDSVAIVDDPHNPMVSFSLVNPPYAKGSSRWDTLDPLTGQTLVFRDWGFDITEIQVSAAPIPEPDTYAMIGLGLGLLGFARRQKG